MLRKEKPKPVTPRQFEVLEYIRLYADHHGKNPSQLAIAHGIDGTQNSVFRMMQLLQDRGVIYRERLCARQYQVISDYELKQNYRA